MARINIPDEKREITDSQEISDFLAPFGIWYENWDVAGRVGDDATNEEILAAYDAEIVRLKERGGFVTADVIAVNRDTPNLDAMLAKFSKEHTHREDEIRFTVHGRGIFHVNPDNGPVFGILVESGDLVNVPAGARHWFDLCADRQIRCIRLFKDPAGWSPIYVDDPVNENYIPICLGPDFLPPADDETDPVVKVE
ncbi:MAG: acireductone dioxygenase [Pirellulaceae bacterium]|jgi:1,2-dihydroxy-3-keto-5-methylthiopentene dioxygenase|nr:acireductone dioxygenase [Pirellulaceae bacterium]MDP7015983.1 acireductone dioxygenase [Pirellulaceae bacterium]